jgi:putative ABC transport system permease protein
MMLKNYLKTAWRSIVHNKTPTLINLFGLSLTLVAFIFIALWVQNELNFDNYHKNAKDIYLVEMKFNAADEPGPLTSLPVADVVKEAHDAAHVARMGIWRGALNVNGQLFDENTGIAVDSDWFKIFDYQVVSGSLNAANTSPFTLIFTESEAKRLFGNKNPIGKIVKLDTTFYEVKAIIKDNPTNSSLQFNMIVPMAARLAFRKSDFNNWGNLSYRTFVKVYPNTRTTSFIKNVTASSLAAAKRTDFSLHLQPLSELHFDTKSFDPAFRRGSHLSVFVFSALAFLLLITASINYINLTVAKANSRTKEISIRKIMGGSRMQLFFQFLTESFLLCLIALFFSLIIMGLALPAFNRLTETNFTLSFSSPVLWPVLLGTLLFTTLLNGIFPAITLAYFQPLSFLRGYTVLKFKNVFFRKGLVVFQFVIGVVFIIGTIVVFLQMQLAQTSAAQYNRAQVVSLELPSQALLKMNYDNQRVNQLCQTIKNDLENSSSIQSVALASTPIEGPTNSSGADNWYWRGMDTSLHIDVARLFVSQESKGIFNFQLKEGRWFSPDNSDRKNYILNETAIKEFGIQEPIIGQLFAKKGGDTGQIIGVLKDYNFSSLYNKIGPMIIANSDDDWRTIFFIKIASGNIPKAMKEIAASWEKFIPNAPFKYEFMDQAFDNLYKSDLKISKLILLFSCISIIISALGLFAHVAFVAEQKTKEIGIRKVLGASVTQIATMLSRDFIKLVLLAIIIASPLAWWAMNSWLQNFVYRIDIGWWVFGLASLTVIIIAITTISFQAIKAAIANPAKSLRTQ